MLLSGLTTTTAGQVEANPNFMEHSTTQEEIRIELTELKTELVQLRIEQTEIKRTLGEVRDKVLGTQVCPHPGLCMLLRQQGEDREARLRALERRDAYVVGACALLGILMPIMMRFFFKI